jgi:probable HAF family extracellular repeat protein
MTSSKFHPTSKSRSNRMFLGAAAAAGVLGGMAIMGTPSASAQTTYNFTALPYLSQENYGGSYGEGSYSYATAINNSGTVAGEALSASGYGHAFSYTVAGGMTDLGTLPGGLDSVAEGINDSGTVVGWTGYTPGAQGYGPYYYGTDQAFSYSGGVMTGLGTLGGTSSAAYGINNAGTRSWGMHKHHHPGTPSTHLHILVVR